ncbi:molecular chaperone DnaJ [Streptomyces sp. NPDC021020]|uniref:molecular chaperone DnaJ n=1 Tax=Streptomyces sp. NPDC021020 TaxID=3365109 RepID=UPI00378F1492
MTGPDAASGADFEAVPATPRGPAAPDLPSRSSGRTPRHTYAPGPALTEGDLATLLTARYEDGGEHRTAVLKTARHPRDNDLLEHEADILARLRRVGEERHRAYAPALIESFEQPGGDGGPRRVNALEPLDGFRTLAEVAAAHPGGLDPRDAAWMWRRLLTGLGWAHRAGLVHGAVFPEHVLIHPALHGVALVDWCYATAAGTDLPVLVFRHAADYPPEAPAHRPATAATDLHLAARCIAGLMGDRAPAPLRAFLRGCTLPEQHRRPQDAWALLAELDDLLERLYGPRTFRPFTMPPAPAG